MNSCPLLKQFYPRWKTQKSSRDYMRSWIKRVEIDDASDLSIALSIVRYAWAGWDWTGQQDACFKHVDSPVNNLQDHDAYVSSNGCSPTWSCGPMSCTIIGALALQVDARQVATSHLTTGAVDNALEIYSRDLEKWVLIIPHLDLYFVSPAAVPLSLLEWAQYDRIGIRPAPIGKAKPRCIPDAFDCWHGMSRTPRVMRGCGPYSGLSPIPKEAWQMMPVLPMPPGEKPVNTLEYGTFDPDSITNPP